MNETKLSSFFSVPAHWFMVGTLQFFLRDTVKMLHNSKQMIQFIMTSAFWNFFFFKAVLTLQNYPGCVCVLQLH